MHAPVCMHDDGTTVARVGSWKLTSRFTSMQNLDVIYVIHIWFTSMQKWLDFSHLESHPCRIWK